MRSLSIFHFVVVGVALAAGLAWRPEPALAADKPNIIFVLADDLGIPGLGCYGGKFATPNLDAMAAGGMRFDLCFSAPLCAPSRAMCMFGRYGFRTGVVNNNTGGRATPQGEVCIAKALKQAGYVTGVSGKWRQLQYFQSKADGATWGWDEFLIWGAGLGDDDEGEGGGKKGAGKKAKGSRYWSPDYNLNGSRLKGAEGKYGPDVLQQFVLDFVQRHKDEPFFVYYPMPLVHTPIEPTPDSANQKKGKGEKKKGHSLYADNIAYVDKQVGELLADLDRLKLREKTLVLFVGDNGSVGGGKVRGQEIDGGKGTMREGGSRVPLIANWPGVTPKGVVKDDLVDFTDFFPTFAELAGAKLPEGVTIDGHSFAPPLRGQTGSPRSFVYVQLSGKHYVRDPGWKLTDDGSLFDMREAPYREIPAPDNSEAKAARERLQAALAQLRSGVKSDGSTEEAVAQKAKKGHKKGKKRK